MKNGRSNVEFAITPNRYRPQVLLLPYDTHGHIALLGARYERGIVQWGLFQGGVDEHYERARAGKPLREEDFLAAAQRELTEETFGGDLGRIILTEHTIKKPGMRRPRDGFDKGKFFYVAGVAMENPRALTPNPENLRGYNHRIAWVRPEQVIYRLRRYEGNCPIDSRIAEPVRRTSKLLLRAA